MKQNEASNKPGYVKKQKNEYILGSWNDKTEYLEITNPFNFDFMSPLAPYYVIMEPKGREVKNGIDILYFLLKTFGQETIEETSYSYDGKEYNSSGSKLRLELQGEKEEIIEVELEIFFKGGEKRRHNFKIWYFPLKEYINHGLNVPAFSRVVLEQSSIPFIAPLQEHTVEWWATGDSKQQKVLDELAGELLKDLPDTPHVNCRRKVEQILSLLNKNVWKGYSSIDVSSKTPGELYRLGVEGNRISHFAFNYLAVCAFQAFGITARLLYRCGPGRAEFCFGRNCVRR
jgi:hypothetical protein